MLLKKKMKPDRNMVLGVLFFSLLFFGCPGGPVTTGDAAVDSSTCVGALNQPCCPAPNECTSPLVCTNGFCVSTTTPPTCGTANLTCCTDTTREACDPGLTCDPATFRCVSSTDQCGTAEGQQCCTSGDQCPPSELTCCGTAPGECVNTSTNARFCGSCTPSEPCEGTCTNGECITSDCGGPGQDCCDDGESKPCETIGYECKDGKCQEVEDCNATGTACESKSECCPPLECLENASNVEVCCIPATGECSSRGCCGTMACTSDRCVCRQSGQTCVNDSDCCSGLSCDDDVCSTDRDPCASYSSSCSRCAQRSDCGYCKGSETCMSGNSSEPSTGTCSSGWTFSSTGCEDDCSQFSSSCQNCAEQSHCGWCSTDTDHCLEGDRTGPEDSLCEDDDWFYNRADCNSSAADECRIIDSCFDCVDDSDCGWCDGQGCYGGTYSGPTGDICDWNDWYWSEEDLEYCPGYVDCSEFDENCAQCLAHTDDGCGWCDTTSPECTKGDWGGPDDGSCGYFEWDWFGCG